MRIISYQPQTWPLDTVRIAFILIEYLSRLMPQIWSDLEQLTDTRMIPVNDRDHVCALTVALIDVTEALGPVVEDIDHFATSTLHDHHGEINLSQGPLEEASKSLLRN